MRHFGLRSHQSHLILKMYLVEEGGVVAILVGKARLGVLEPKKAAAREGLR